MRFPRDELIIGGPARARARARLRLTAVEHRVDIVRGDAAVFGDPEPWTDRDTGARIRLTVMEILRCFPTSWSVRGGGRIFLPPCGLVPATGNWLTAGAIFP